MSRTIPILSGEDFVRERTFTGVHPDITRNYWGSVVLANSKEKDIFRDLVEAVPYQNAPSYSSLGNRAGYPNRKYRNFDRQTLGQLNAQYFKKYRPDVPTAVVKYFIEASGWRDRSESAMISAFMLNEFLAQTEYNIYHDFLNEKWDELYPLAIESHIKVYAHTVDVYKHMGEDSVITFRPKATKKIQRVLEDLTREELLKLVSLSDRKRTDVKSLPIVIPNILKGIDGSLERQLSPREAINQLLRAFSVSLLAGGQHSKLELPRVYQSITEVVMTIRSNRLARDQVNYTANQITPNDLGTIGEFLEKNGSEFSIDEMFFIIYSLANHKVFARNGHTAEIAEIYLDFLKRENSLELFKLVGELGLNYNGILPTALQWKKALANDELDFVFSAEVTAVLIAKDDKKGTRTNETSHYRRLFGESSVG